MNNPFIIKGRDVKIAFGKDTEVPFTVYPIGAKHIRQYSRNVMGIIRILWEQNQEDPQQFATAALMSSDLIPIVIEHALDIINDCVQFEGEGIDLDSLPHWVVPQIVEIWIDESFGSETKLRPWVEAIEKALKKVMKREVSLSSLFSKLSSPPDTQSKESS